MNVSIRLESKPVATLGVVLHKMKLQASAYARVRSGAKMLELRLYDEKRQRIQLGDTIEFTELSDLVATVRAHVIGLLIYPTFASLIDDIPTALMGYQETDRDYLRTGMYEIYSPEDEAKYGVLGIRFQLLG